MRHLIPLIAAVPFVVPASSQCNTSGPATSSVADQRIWDGSAYMPCPPEPFGTNSSNIYQEGSNHVAKTFQRDDNNSADIQQLGLASTGNTAILTQSGDGNATYVEQNGNNNFAREVTSRGDNNDLFVSQTGNGNSVMFELWGDDNATSITQASNNNTVMISARLPTPPAPTGRDGNAITIDQGGGDGNLTTIRLEDGSDNNQIDVTQNGTNHVVDGSPYGKGIYIDGDMNAVVVSQMGVGKVAWAALIGNQNTITIIQ